MPHRVRFAWIAPPMLAVLSLPALATLVAGSPPPAVTLTLRPAWSSPVAMRACAGPAAAGQGPAAWDGVGGAVTGPAQDPAWVVRPSLDPDGTLEGWTLATASRGVEAAELRLPPEASVTGPVDGRIVVTADDGHQSTISLVAPGSGCAETVHHAGDVIRQAIRLPRSGAVLFHSVGRLDRSDRGVQVLPGSGRPPVQLLPPLEAADPALAEIGRVWSTRLLAATDGALVAVQSCGETACRTRLAEVGSGRARWLPGAHGPLVGLAARTAVFFDACPGLPCPLLAADVEGDGRRRLSEAAYSALAAGVGGRPLVVAVEEHNSAWALTAIELVGTNARRLPFDARNLALLPPGTPAAGMEPRDGWIAAVDPVTGLPFGIDLASLLAGATEVAR